MHFTTFNSLNIISKQLGLSRLFFTHLANHTPTIILIEVNP